MSEIQNKVNVNKFNIVNDWADLIHIYKNEDEIEINKNTMTNLTFLNQNEDQQSILTNNKSCSKWWHKVLYQKLDHNI